MMAGVRFDTGLEMMAVCDRYWTGNDGGCKIQYWTGNYDGQRFDIGPEITAGVRFDIRPEITTVSDSILDLE